MRLNCGRGEPNETHGDDHHVTMDDPRAAAASKISPMQAVHSIVNRVGTGGGRGG